MMWVDKQGVEESHDPEDSRGTRSVTQDKATENPKKGFRPKSKEKHASACYRSQLQACLIFKHWQRINNT